MRRGLGLVVVCALSGIALYAWAQKKGGEKCESDSDCETRTCRSDKTCDPCPDRNNCPKPGTCSLGDHDSYQRNKNDTCNQARSCSDVASFNDKEVSFEELNTRLKANNACINARTEVMEKCYKGGDDRHQEERKKTVEVRDKCSELIDYKKGKSFAYFCSQSDYDSYERSIESACRKDDITCSESKNDDPIDCGKLESRISAGEKCVKAREDMTYRCFDNRWSWIRTQRKQESEAATATCKDVLKHKKDRSLCK